MKKYFFVGLILLSIFLFGHSVLSAGVEEKTFFTEKQEVYLANHPYIFAYFKALYSDKKTPEQIAKDYKLSHMVNQKYLKALSDIGVIAPPKDLKTSPNFLVNGVCSFSAGGPLSKKLTDLQFKQHYEQTLLDTKKDNQNDIVLAPGMWLTEKEYDNYKKEILALEDKYINLSVQNRKVNNPAAFRVSVLINTISKWEPSVFTDIKKDF